MRNQWRGSNGAKAVAPGSGRSNGGHGDAALRSLRSPHEGDDHEPRLQRHRRRRACAGAGHFVGRLHGPGVSRPRAAAGRQQRRQGDAADRRKDPRQPAGHGRHRRRRRAPGRGPGLDDGLQGRPPRRVRPAQAHPRHGSRRHRRGVPLSEHGAVRRLGAGPAARRRDVPRLQPLARRLLQALSRPPVRHRHAADAVDRPGDQGDAASRARNWASAAASSGPTPTTTR